jgi:hypothetical protein
MKRIIFNLVLAVFILTIYSCGESVPQHCPSYSKSYSKIKLKKTKGVNSNVFANGIRAPRKNSYR